MRTIRTRQTLTFTPRTKMELTASASAFDRAARDIRTRVTDFAADRRPFAEFLRHVPRPPLGWLPALFPAFLARWFRACRRLRALKGTAWDVTPWTR